MEDIRGRVTKDGIRIYEDADFAGMRTAGRVAAEILDMVGPLVRPGATTAALDDFIREEIAAAAWFRPPSATRAISTPPAFPSTMWSATASRAAKVLKDGDILNIDVTVIVDGWFGDTSRMYVAGTAPRKAERLIEVTHEALMRGIAAVKPGNTFGDIGHAIQSFVEANRMSVVRDFCGHGLGRVFHAPPNVLHYGRPGSGAGAGRGHVLHH